jgi:acetyl-CoA synthetase (ADP-forming)
VDREAVNVLVDQARKEKRDLLLSEALQVLEHYGINAVHSAVAKTVEQAQSAAAEMGYPVAIKVIAGQISHKSDAGGVQLNLRNPEALATAYMDMVGRIRQAYPQIEMEGVLVQPMVTGGRELILGGRQDPQFGPVVLLGLGGVFVEILEEVVVRIAPLSKRLAEEMVESLRGVAILKGARGHKPADLNALVEALLRLSQLLCDFPEIRELDINPLRLFSEGEGCCALDARIILG